MNEVYYFSIKYRYKVYNLRMLSLSLFPPYRDLQKNIHIIYKVSEKYRYKVYNDFSIKYRYSDILLKKKNLKHLNFIYNRLFCCNHTCYCVGMISVTSASRYVTQASRYQRDVNSRSDSTELTETVPIEYEHDMTKPAN